VEPDVVADAVAAVGAAGVVAADAVVDVVAAGVVVGVSVPVDAAAVVPGVVVQEHYAVVRKHVDEKRQYVDVMHFCSHSNGQSGANWMCDLLQYERPYAC